MDKLKFFPRCHPDPRHSRKCFNFVIDQAKRPYDIKTTPPLNATEGIYALDPYYLFWKHPEFEWIRKDLNLFDKFKNIIINSHKLLHTRSRILKNDLKHICYHDDKLTRYEINEKLKPFIKYPNPRWVPNMLSVFMH